MLRPLSLIPFLPIAAVLLLGSAQIGRCRAGWSGRQESSVGSRSPEPAVPSEEHLRDPRGWLALADPSVADAVLLRAAVRPRIEQGVGDLDRRILAISGEEMRRWLRAGGSRTQPAPGRVVFGHHIERRLRSPRYQAEERIRALLTDDERSRSTRALADSSFSF